jgi:hypothetical protein
MPGQWVDVGARRLIDGTALDPRGPTRRPSGKRSLRTAAGRTWCAAVAVGTMAASVLPLPLDGLAAQAAWAALWAVAGYVAIWTGFFIYHLCRYRSSGFRDHNWLARHDDSDPGGALFLELVSRSPASLNPGDHLELCVKSHGNWEVVEGHDVVLMPDKVIRCRFDLHHKVFPGGFYDVRWFHADDRGKLVEITRERFHCGITPSAAGQDLYCGPIQDWLPKRCPSARTRSSRGGRLPKRWPAWPAGTTSVHGER